MSEMTESSGQPLSRDEMLSALFVQLVMQQANMALMLMGKVAHPQTGQIIKDLEAAKLFIDQMEMLEAKTRGNLNPADAQFLQESLTSLRLAFVEAVQNQGQPGQAPAEPPQAAPTAEQPQPSPAPAAEEEPHKKFTKKY